MHSPLGTADPSLTGTPHKLREEQGAVEARVECEEALTMRTVDLPPWSPPSSRERRQTSRAQHEETEVCPQGLELEVYLTVSPPHTGKPQTNFLQEVQLSSAES